MLITFGWYFPPIAEVQPTPDPKLAAMIAEQGSITGVTIGAILLVLIIILGVVWNYRKGLNPRD
ncbi:MAG: hypothetical protein AB1345_00965 [Chloroflexota bacterium]